MVPITKCPTCGSEKIERIRRDWTATVGDRVLIVPDLEFYECPSCGERVYEPEAMQQIDASVPPVAKRGVATPR